MIYVITSYSVMRAVSKQWCKPVLPYLFVPCIVISCAVIFIQHFVKLLWYYMWQYFLT